MESKTKPEPTPVAGTEKGPKRVLTDEEVIVTTAGLAFAATWTTASEESRLTLVVLPAGAGLGVATEPEGRSTATVPTDASVADRSDRAMTGISERETR